MSPHPKHHNQLAKAGAVASLVGLACAVLAADSIASPIVFDDGGVHSYDGTTDQSVTVDFGTTLNIRLGASIAGNCTTTGGGPSGALCIQGGSVVNVLGGTIEGVGLSASQIFMYDGTINGVIVGSGSEIYILGGTVDGIYVSPGFVYVAGGILRHGIFINPGRIEIVGGVIEGGLGSFGPADEGFIRGGTFIGRGNSPIPGIETVLFAYNGVHWEVSGGQFEPAAPMWATAASTLTFLGTGLVLDGPAPTDTEPGVISTLTGRLLDGNPILAEVGYRAFGQEGGSNVSVFNLIEGSQLSILDSPQGDPRKSRILIKLADQGVAMPVPGSRDDPRCTEAGGGGSGGVIEASSETSGQTFAQALPCEHWTLLESGGEPVGYAYRDTLREAGPCWRLSLYGRHSVQAECSGGAFPPYDLEPGRSELPVRVTLMLGTGTSHCAQFSGDAKKVKDDGSDGESLNVKGSPAPTTCRAPSALAASQASDGDQGAPLRGAPGRRAR